MSLPEFIMMHDLNNTHSVLRVEFGLADHLMVNLEGVKRQRTEEHCADDHEVNACRAEHLFVNRFVELRFGDGVLTHESDWNESQA